MKLKQIYEAIACRDETSWIAHWMICTVSTVLVFSLFGATAAVIAANLLLVGFAFREGGDYQRHKLLYHDMKRYGFDGLMDFAGPLVNAVMWWVIYV